MAVNVYLPHFKRKSKKDQSLVVKKSKLSGAEDYEKEIGSVLRKHKVVIVQCAYSERGYCKKLLIIFFNVNNRCLIASLLANLVL